MRTALPTILRRIPLNLQESGTDVTLTWTEFSGATTDPVTGARSGGTATTKTTKVKGFIHEVSATSVVRQFAEIEAGDAIVDLAGDVALDGKEALRFTIDGRQFVAKEIPEKLARSWDVIFRGKRLHRSVLLRKAT